MTRQVTDFPTQLPHFPTIHVYIGLLLFFLPLKASTTRYNLLHSKFQPFKVQNLFIFRFCFLLMAQDTMILSLSLSLSLKTSSSSTSNFSGSKHRFLIHFINISIFFILFSPTNLRFSSISF